MAINGGQGEHLGRMRLAGPDAEPAETGRGAEERGDRGAPYRTMRFDKAGAKPHHPFDGVVTDVSFFISE